MDTEPNSTGIDHPASGSRAARQTWIDDWRPEDEQFWESTGKRIAWRNLWFSIFAEHIGFSVWTIWSVLVLFMGEDYGLTPADKFLLVSLPAAVGALLRLPYTFAVAWFGGRNWTIVSALLLLVPIGLAALVLEPGVSYSTLLLVALTAGVGGGNFASSMANINTFFPDRVKGGALGLNAGGGNLGVAVIQLLGLAVLATAGPTAPRLLLAVYLPLIVVAALCAALFMNNLTMVKNDSAAAREALADRQMWVMGFLYIGTFGSFIGFSFAFGLVLQLQFDRTPLEAAAVTFIGPLVGSLIRPVGGWLADRMGGSRVTLLSFLAMGTSVVIIVIASQTESLGIFTAGFLLLFVFSGVGNGSTYKMIPAIYQARAASAVEAGLSEDAARAQARRISSAVIGIVSAVGALGGLFINLAFRQSFAATGSGVPAFLSFLAFYGLCAAVTYVVYLRPRARIPSERVLAYAGV